MAYCKKPMRHPFLILGISSLLVIGAAVAMFFSESGAVAYNTVEINLAEVSPKGEAGGYAIPASGSTPSCTIHGLPATMYQGQTFWLYYTPNIAMNVTRNGVSRGTTAGSPWNDSTSSGLATGTYTYAISGSVAAGEHCATWGTYCAGGDIKSGGTTCWSECLGTETFYDTYSCSGTLTVAAAPNIPNLISANLQMPGNPTYIPTSVPVTFTARVENVGTTDASGFSDMFRYYPNPSGPWQGTSTVSWPGGLESGSYHTDTSGTMTFWTPGTQLVGHCVDYTNQVTESSESDNCTQRLYEVSTALSASCSGSPASVDEDETVTWTASASGGSGGYSYQWSGADSLSGSGVSIQKSYANSGTKTASVIVTDGYGRSSGWVACSSVIVNDDDPAADIEARVLGSGSAWSDGPITIAASDEVELQWDSERASSCTGDAYYSTGGATSGSTGVVSETAGGQSRTYTVTCSDGSDSDSDTVQVNRDIPTSPPTLVADPDRVRQGETTNLTGNLNGHSGCTITGGTTNISVPDGTNAFSYTSGAIMGETVITLNCTLGEASDTVRILPAVEHF